MPEDSETTAEIKFETTSKRKREARPWGWYEILTSGPGFQTKRLTVKTESRLSLQWHRHRDETWVVARGTARVTVGEKEHTLGRGQSMFVARNVYLFLLVLILVNASASAVDTLYKTLMQSNVSNEQRGRAMGSWVLSIGMAPIGHLGVGGMAGALGAPGALLINGSILTALSVSALLGLPRIRRLN